MEFTESARIDKFEMLVRAAMAAGATLHDAEESAATLILLEESENEGDEDLQPLEDLLD